jgi:uncharacterized protein (DUF1778 family)
MIMKKRAKKDAIERLAMLVPSALKEKYSRAAALRGETFSVWAKHALDEAAELQLREHECTDMALSDSISFMEAVQNHPRPTVAAVQAAKRYKKAFNL